MGNNFFSPTAIAAIGTEISALSKVGLRIAARIPYVIGKSVLTDPKISDLRSQDRIRDILGDLIIESLAELGPFYGKLSQIALTRMGGEASELVEKAQLDRIFNDWPAIEISEVEHLLDQEIPAWRDSLTLETCPIGVASMAQVHAAKGRDGKEWVVKVLKPSAVKRLNETLDALEQVLQGLESFAVLPEYKRLIDELKSLCQSLRRETSLRSEARNLIAIQGKLGDKQKAIRVPIVNSELSCQKVLVMERFRGTSLVEIVSGKAALPVEIRKKLAKRVFQEVLVQIFEVGLFHADPHAGNLILLETGELGLVDWGLTGELNDEDRRLIATVLKAALAMDTERLADALVLASSKNGHEVDREDVLSELKGLARKIKKSQEEEKLISMVDVLEPCLKAASHLEIAIPEGLLLMAKTLMTIEALAKGIDPEVSLGRIATPFLLRAAKPGVLDALKLLSNLRNLLKFTKSGES